MILPTSNESVGEDDDEDEAPYFAKWLRGGVI